MPKQMLPVFNTDSSIQIFPAPQIMQITVGHPHFPKQGSKLSVTSDQVSEKTVFDSQMTLTSTANKHPLKTLLQSRHKYWASGHMHLDLNRERLEISNFLNLIINLYYERKQLWKRCVSQSCTTASTIRNQIIIDKGQNSAPNKTQPDIIPELQLRDKQKGLAISLQ